MPRALQVTQSNLCVKENMLKELEARRILHTGTGFVERTIRSIKDLIRTNLQDGLKFTDSVKLTVKTMRLTPNSRLKITLFELHMGRKPRTSITNIVNGENCLLSKWEKINYGLYFSSSERTTGLHDKG